MATRYGMNTGTQSEEVLAKGLVMKILHVLDYSLRSRQAGYTIRSKYIFDAQREIGLEPIVATRFKDAHLMVRKHISVKLQ